MVFFYLLSLCQMIEYRYILNWHFLNYKLQIGGQFDREDRKIENQQQKEQTVKKKRKS